jgi:tetratricopeptide (TPR) repeat protein
MSKLAHIRQVCLDLIAKEKRKPVFEILDFYFPLAKTISDYDILGELALKAENRDLYLKCAESAYAIAETSEQLYIARSNLYKAYNALNYPEKALFYVEKNLEITPDDFETKMNKSFNLALMGRRKEAEDIIESLIANNPKDAENIRYSLSGKMLREGRTADGIVNFIDTFKPKSVLFEDHLKMKKWVGMPQPGKKIYVNGEGGVGDEIINIRFFDWLRDYGMEPILYSSWNMYRPDTVDLFRRHGYQVICEWYSIDTNELWTNMMPIPGYLGLNEDDLWRGPYLFPLRDPKNKLDSKKFKIGIKCNGNPYFSQDQYRCIPIDELLAAIPKNNNVEIYYFDKEKTHPDTVNLKDKLETWEHTLDYIDQMDVIVSSCTSLVHAAGAMDKRTIVIVPLAEYYIWTSSRTNNTTPWYSDNVTVLKQSRVRSWQEPLAKMTKLVQDMINNYDKQL